MNDLLNPPCAEADRFGRICPRCGNLPGDACGDTAARAAQEAVRALSVPVVDLLDPKCAEVTKSTLPCERCGCRPNDMHGHPCDDTAARDAQIAALSLSPSPGHPPSPEAPTALPGGVAEALGLPWSEYDACHRMWSELDKNVTNGEMMAFYRRHLRLAFDAGAVLAANHHAALVEALVDCLASVEMAEKIKHPKWQGTATPTSVIGVARALLERIRAGGGG